MSVSGPAMRTVPLTTARVCRGSVAKSLRYGSIDVFVAVSVSSASTGFTSEMRAEARGLHPAWHSRPKLGERQVIPRAR